ncbi:kinase-like domain-containing protein [Phlyctochytrium arcticum]|nr:kinase-like domain-containing protein [Phlyctochytrium arcticum]
MSSFFSSSKAAAASPVSSTAAGPSRLSHSQAHRQSASNLAANQGPPGSIPPGTVLSINASKVVVERFLAQGGFAHVYVVLVGNDQLPAVMKRVACPDQEALVGLEKEIQFMKQLNGHKNIVKYFDSSIQRMRSGYEVFIIMEYCRGGHLVDFLNTRLSNRLTEAEVLAIFSDVCEAVAHMHYSNPTIIHRDIKVENVLIANDGTYKLCDFGSATTQYIPPGTAMTGQDIRLLEDEIGRHTTLQYRSPELCDLYQKRGLTEKMDMWALGVLLYKLCYFTTPFEDTGTLAIINVRYTMPSHPSYSRNLQSLIESMLVADVGGRADIYHVYSTVCRLRGLPCDLRMKTPTSGYGSAQPPALRTATPPQPTQLPASPYAEVGLTSSSRSQSLLSVGSSSPSFSDTPTMGQMSQSGIPPMRRGRPTPRHGKAPSISNINSATELTPSLSLLNLTPAQASNAHNPFGDNSAPPSAYRLTAPPDFFNNTDFTSAQDTNALNRLTAPPELFNRFPDPKSSTNLINTNPGFNHSPFSTAPLPTPLPISPFNPFPIVADPHTQQLNSLPPQGHARGPSHSGSPFEYDPFDPNARRGSDHSGSSQSGSSLRISTPPQPYVPPQHLYANPRPFTKSASDIRLNKLDAPQRRHGHSRNKSWAQARHANDGVDDSSSSSSDESIEDTESKNVADLVQQFQGIDMQSSTGFSRQSSGSGNRGSAEVGFDGLGARRMSQASGPPRATSMISPSSASSSYIQTPNIAFNPSAPPKPLRTVTPQAPSPMVPMPSSSGFFQGSSNDPFSIGNSAVAPIMNKPPGQPQFDPLVNNFSAASWAPMQPSHPPPTGMSSQPGRIDTRMWETASQSLTSPSSQLSDASHSSHDYSHRKMSSKGDDFLRGLMQGR